MKFYVIEPVELPTLNRSEGFRAFEISPWAGQGYGKKKEANEVKAFLEKKFGIKFVVKSEEDNLLN